MRIHLTGGRSVTLRAMLAGEDDNADGLYWDHSREIAVNAEATPQRQAEVLIHECIHAIWAQREMPKRVTEESACIHLGAAFALLVQLNPLLMPLIDLAMNKNVPLV